MSWDPKDEPLSDEGKNVSFKRLYGYATLEDAYHSASALKEAGIECLLSHREKGLFGDPETSDLTWISVPEADFDRASELLFPKSETLDVQFQLQCPRCKSLQVKFDVVSHKKGLGKIFTWPWDKERFFCQDCKHVWDRQPDD